MPLCSACTGLDKEMRIWHGLDASRIYQRGLSIAESEQLRSESWFQRHNKQLVSCTKKLRSGLFSIGMFNRGGSGYHEKEHFGPHLNVLAREVFTHPLRRY